MTSTDVAQAPSRASVKIELELGALYDSNVVAARFIIDLYRKLYQLPAFVHRDDVSAELFAYCSRRLFFVNIIAFQGDKVFLKRRLGAQLGWELPGSGVLSKGQELFEDAVTRILDRDIPTVLVGELRPVAYLDKVYVNEPRVATHFGLVYIGRVSSPGPEAIERNEQIKGRFVSIHDTAEIARLVELEQRLVDLGRQIVLSYPPLEHIEQLDREVTESSRIPSFFRLIHDRLVRPMGRRFSSQIIRSHILKFVAAPDVVLDVACGDDDFVFEVARKSTFVVANDLYIGALRGLAKRKGTHSRNVIFVNHDACHLPFRVKFDLAICKNLLHHMDTRDELQLLLRNLRNVATRVIIVDPENPRLGGVRAKLWNLYYRRVLRDQGDRFLSRDSFRDALSSVYGTDCRIQLEEIKTVKGRYMLGYIDFEADVDPEQAKHIASGTSKRVVIFDLDGLLVNTEPLFLQAMRSALAERGVTLDDSFYIEQDLQLGRSTLDELARRGHLNNIDVTEQRLYSGYRDLLRQGVPAMPGAIDAVKRLRPHFQLALASSSKREFIDIILRSLGINDLFDFVVGREDVSKLKPDPECLRKVLAFFNVTPAECVMVEDSYRGYLAAEKLGMATIIVPNELSDTNAYRNAIVVDSLEKVTPQLIVLR